ncbi:carbohydrate ABC transporter permease [Paenibacillus sp. SYP-B3998]|uniref:Carbohydrate ABC transporter permease n=1 Tax=Paenibacillus sp. SYP-B3998 TaxID=2678564 RepID=A0A6G3ZSE9_9BACL|nr:carbohydrate ABC transporter permease [Paenibacillus sp. SYP-B3998]NEW04980.1 carbohydrate ABC transporter permease [Paenibacillus sp. SYP-B3998]
MGVKRKSDKGDLLFDSVIYLLIIFVCVITLYPFVYVISLSISNTSNVMHNDVLLFPKGFNLAAYKAVLSYKGIFVAYGNTLFYTLFGTLISLMLTAFAAYPLSRKEWKFRNVATIFLAITLWFGGGMIPFYLMMKDMHLLNTRLGVLLYAAISTFYIIVMRTYFASLPKELEESAKIDGANDLRIFFQIVLPLSKPVLAAIGLYYAIDKWNSFFWEMILLNKDSLLPVQALLVRIIRDSSFDKEIQSALTHNLEVLPITIQYAAIIVTSLPIIFAYPFLQKYFVKGVMIGAIKN